MASTRFEMSAPHLFWIREPAGIVHHRRRSHCPEKNFRLLRGEGGILTQPLLLSYHLFSNMRENRINIDDFSTLASFNSLSYLNRLG
jgi:hypothetical protein